MLTYVEPRDGYSVYLDDDENEVYLADGSFRRLVPFDELDLAELWLDWTLHHSSLDESGFRARVESLTTEPDFVEDIRFCLVCHSPHHLDDVTCVSGGDQVACETCLDKSFCCCERCEEYHWSANGSRVSGDWWCDHCRDNYATYCGECDEWCRDDYFSDEHDHGNNCDCESPAGHRFQVRNDGQDPLRNDRRVTITLPAGEISEEGIREIRRVVDEYFRELDYQANFVKPALSLDEQRDLERRQYMLRTTFAQELGPKWQTKEGNYTKRLSRLAYSKYKIKLDPAIISEVGNIGAAHSTAIDFQIEVTRDLNLSAEDFGNAGSCWWGSYGTGRCSFKSNGGFGIRSFNQYDGVTGRVWVMPLKLKNPDRHVLTPTFETENPDAFVVFNGYGDLSGYVGARIVAHMSGLTYRKVEFDDGNGYMYVNGGSGYLVAPEHIAEHYTDSNLRFYLENHSELYSTEQSEREELTHVA